MSLESFEDKYPGSLEKLRKTEFTRLGVKVYLDNTGSALYANSQLNKHVSNLAKNLYGNPHSGSASGELTNDVIHQVRSTVLEYFKVTNDDYDVVFTKGATDSLRIIGEHFSWSEGSLYAYLQDNHTSVVGIREIAARNHVKSYCLTHNVKSKTKHGFDDLRAYSPKLIKECECAHTISCPSKSSNAIAPCMFAFPAQSNFSGAKYPMSWANEVQQRGNVLDQMFTKIGATNQKWYVLCDAASHVSTSPLDLRENPADFVALSFYKIFGFPTGIGALLIKKRSTDVVSKKSYFGGGSVSGWLATKDFVVLKQVPHARLEDGSPAFLNIVALKDSFDSFKQLGISPDLIQIHTFTLIKQLYSNMLGLKHFNDTPVVTIYSETDYSDFKKQGPIITFNLLRPDGNYVGFNHVLQLASIQNFHLRGGCFCNMGACSALLNVPDSILQKAYEDGHVCSDSIDVIDGRPIGALRVSLGYASSQSDVDKFTEFLIECFTEDGQDDTDIFFDSFCEPVNDVVTLEKIYVYPIKSCQGMEVTDWEICDTGLRLDRNWMIVDENMVCVTLKKNPRLVIIKPWIDRGKNVLRLSTAGKKDITVPILFENDKNSRNVEFYHPRCTTKVCGDTIQGYNCGTDVSEWLTTCLGQVSFLLQKSLALRIVKKRLQPNGQTTAVVSLVNEAQYLLINRASVEFLLAKINKDESVSQNKVKIRVDNLIKRFRSNFVIAGPEPFAENNWTAIDICSRWNKDIAPFAVCGLCSRCSMVCVDPCTGEKCSEPLRILSKISSCVDYKKNTFGIYMQCGVLEGHITVNSTITVKKP